MNVRDLGALGAVVAIVVAVVAGLLLTGLTLQSPSGSPPVSSGDVEREPVTSGPVGRTGSSTRLDPATATAATAATAATSNAPVVASSPAGSASGTSGPVGTTGPTGTAPAPRSAPACVGAGPLSMLPPLLSRMLGIAPAGC
jgi:hypothetical protein